MLPDKDDEFARIYNKNIVQYKYCSYLCKKETWIL